MTDELKASLQSDDYTEIDLKKWLEQLKEIRKMLENPSNIQIIDDNDPLSTIYLIQVKQTSSSTVKISSFYSLKIQCFLLEYIAIVEYLRKMCSKLFY